mgnify:CR=1 FL=1
MELVKGNFSSLEDALRAQTLKLQNQIEKLERQVHVAKFERDEWRRRCRQMVIENTA